MDLVIDELKVFAGNAHPGLAKSVCEYLGIPVGQSEAFKFANDNNFHSVIPTSICLLDRSVF